MGRKKCSVSYVIIFFELFEAEFFMLCRWLVDWHLYILLFLCLKVERNSVDERCTLIHIIAYKNFKMKTFWEGTAVTLCLRSLGITLIGDSSIFWKVIIPNGLYSEKIYSEGLSCRNLYLERSLFQRFFISKGHYSEDFYPEGSLFRNSE